MDCLGIVLDIVSTAATVGAVCIAIFGDVIKKKLFGPRLKVKMPESLGQVIELPDGNKRAYYHIDVVNSGEFQAKNVIVLMKRVEEEWDGGKRIIWDGEIPLRWVYAESHKLQWFNITDNNECDLVSLDKDGLMIMTSFAPYGIKQSWNEACNIYLTIVAKSDETVSKQVIVHIVWDGTFVDNIDEMKKHLVISLE